MNPTFDHLFKDFFVVRSNGEEIPFPMENMDELVSRINLYKNMTNRRLIVYKSTTSTTIQMRREYRCRCSSRCIFRAKFRLRRSDNRIVLSSAIFYHNTPALA